jgi:hypothetical protein
MSSEEETPLAQATEEEEEEEQKTTPHRTRAGDAAERQRRILSGTATAVHCAGDSACGCAVKLAALKPQFDAASQHTAIANVRRESMRPVAGGQHTNMKGRKLWLLKNMFDPYGNYLFCVRKIESTLGVGVKSMGRYRKQVRTEAAELAERAAAEVTATPQGNLAAARVAVRILASRVLSENLIDRVIVPPNATIVVTDVDSGDMAEAQVDRSNARQVRAWLSALPSGAVVDVTALSPVHYKHGNQGRRNRARTTAFAHLRDFVGMCAHPNGRASSYRGKTSFLEASITSLAPTNLTRAEKQQPEKVTLYEARLRTSLLGRFNAYLECLDADEPPVSASWLLGQMQSDVRLKRVGVSPRRSDYCDACAVYTEQMNRARTRLQRLRQSGSAAAEKLRLFEMVIDGYDALNNLHRAEATRELQVFAERKVLIGEAMQDRVFGNVRGDDWSIANQHRRHVPYMISIDFQMGRQVPHFARTQPGRFYYRQSLVSHTFGIVDHNEPRVLPSTGASNHLYVSDEEGVGSKDANHVITYLHHYIKRININYRHFVIYLDAAPYFKNQYVLGWAFEMVHRRRFDKMELCFMVPGHTKFDPDRLFASVSAALSSYQEDFFSTHDVYRALREKAIAGGVIGSVELFGESQTRCIGDWKEFLGPRNVPFVAITKYGRFVIERKPNQSIVLAAYRTNFDGVNDARAIPNFHGGAAPIPLGFRPRSTRASGAWKPLELNKALNLLRTYRDFVDAHRSRWPKFLLLIESNRDSYYTVGALNNDSDDSDDSDEEISSSSSSSSSSPSSSSSSSPEAVGDDWQIYQSFTDPDMLETGFDGAIDRIVSMETIRTTLDLAIGVQEPNDNTQEIALKLARAHLQLSRQPNSSAAKVQEAFDSQTAGLRNLPMQQGDLSNTARTVTIGRHCTHAGCDGTGHRNVARWHEGHVSQRCCPLRYSVPPPSLSLTPPPFPTTTSSSSSSSSSSIALEEFEDSQRALASDDSDDDDPPLIFCTICNAHDARELCKECNERRICRQSRCGSVCADCNLTCGRAKRRRRR